MSKKDVWKILAGLEHLNSLLERKGVWKAGTILNGIILKKAELEDDFAGVYSTVLERVDELEEIEGDEFLYLLGDIGG